MTTSEFIPKSDQTNDDEVSLDHVFLVLSTGIYLEVERLQDGSIATTQMPHHYPWIDEVRRFETIISSQYLWETVVRVMEYVHRVRTGDGVYSSQKALEVLSGYAQFQETLHEHGVVDTDLFQEYGPFYALNKRTVVLGEHVAPKINVRYAIQDDHDLYTRQVAIDMVDYTNGYDVGERVEYAYNFEVNPGEVLALIQDWRFLHIPLVHQWQKAEEERQQEFEQLKTESLHESGRMLAEKGYAQLESGSNR